MLHQFLIYLYFPTLGSSMEGASLARLANPNLKNLIEIEIDLNIVVGTVSQSQFEACYEPMDQNKAFFNYVIKKNLDDDINICITLPQETEKKIISNIADNSKNLIQYKQCLSGLVLKEYFHNSQPKTDNPLTKISVRGLQGIYNEKLSKAIEGCSAFVRFGTESLSKNDFRVNLDELLILTRKQICSINNKFDEFNEVDCQSIKILMKCIKEQYRFKKILLDIKANNTLDLKSITKKDMSYNELNLTKNEKNEEMVFDDLTLFSAEKDSIIYECEINLKSLYNEITAVLEEWIRSLTAVRELNNHLHKFCLDMKTIFPPNFDTPNSYYFTMVPDYYFRTNFDVLISAWSKDKSNTEEALKLAYTICHIHTNLHFDNLSIVKKRFIEFVQPVLNMAISLIEESLSSSVEQTISTEILIDNVPCFYAPFWPIAASAWIERKRSWPDLELVKSIQKSGFHRRQ